MPAPFAVVGQRCTGRRVEAPTADEQCSASRREIKGDVLQAGDTAGEEVVEAFDCDCGRGGVVEAVGEVGH